MAVDPAVLLSFLRAKELAILEEIRLTEEAREWALGTYSPPPGQFLPAPESEEGRAAWSRAVRRAASVGPRVLATLLNGAIGDVNWGGDSSALDSRLAELDLQDLARRFATDIIVTGAAAGYVYVREEGGEPRIGRLGGFIMPYLDPRDSSVVTGLFQATQVFYPRGLRWWVRVWDLESEEVREWEELGSPTELGRPPTRVIPGARPRFVFWGLTEQGLPVGLLTWAVPMFRDVMASELMLARVEELSAYPIPRFGDNTQLQTVGPGLPIRGEFEWVRPGELGELRAQLQLKVEKLRDALALPGGFLGNDSPSGEALREANIRFRQMCRAIAGLVSKLLTDLVADYAEATGVDPVSVSVSPSIDIDRTDRIQVIAMLYEKGLLPLRVAARELQPFFPTWSDEELEAWLQRQEGLVTPQDVARLLGGGSE